MQSSGNRCRCHRQYIHQTTQLLQLLFVSHTKALLFIDHDQSQVLKMNIAREQAVSSNEDVDLSL